jgi:hypothetical protein
MAWVSAPDGVLLLVLASPRILTRDSFCVTVHRSCICPRVICFVVSDAVSSVRYSIGCHRSTSSSVGAGQTNRFEDQIRKEQSLVLVSTEGA